MTTFPSFPLQAPSFPLQAPSFPRRRESSPRRIAMQRQLALLALTLALPALAQETTPAMVAAAEKEGKVVWYTAVDVKVAEGIAKVFRAQYPKIEIDVERSGSERVFQRINQEYQSNIK